MDLTGQTGENFLDLQQHLFRFVPIVIVKLTKKIFSGDIKRTSQVQNLQSSWRITTPVSKPGPRHKFPKRAMPEIINTRTEESMTKA
ncbi:hypothetical protein WN51_10467 [Melipona quadrifasciata]|uniref:Uncharacterized protein n=1 Tax=Melipona quadrifasciata TaxID=166423 RepID=A0A0M9A6R4_9HYME|nr:hypothetical protein WN51_10467 [Melipona quadrifasciata]